jgi:excisionase family DNA binding protein
MSEYEGLQKQLDRIELNLQHNFNKDVLTLEEACSYCGISKSYMYKLTSAQQIPHFKPRDRLIYFKKSDLESWLLQNRVSTRKEIEAQATLHIIKNKKKA